MKTLAKKALAKLGYNLALSPVTSHSHEHKVAFIHIAKCGGIAIDNALRSQFAQPGDNRLCRHTSIGASLASFAKPPVSMSDCCDFGVHHLNQLQGTLDYFLSLQRHYISGHWATNHDLLTKHSDVDFITVLREPTARLKSNYIFNKLTNDLAIMPPNKASSSDVIKEAEAILFGPRGWQMANTQTAFICGRYPKTAGEAKQMHDEFIANIKLFKLVGVLENLPHFQRRFEEVYSSPLKIKQRNSTKQQQSQSNKNTVEVLEEYFNSSTVKAQLAKICQFEQRHYEKVRALVE